MKSTFVFSKYRFRRMKKYLFFLFALLSLNISGQEVQTIQLSSDKVEAIFLQQNLELIAERMNIDIADADIVQAKLWENPELSISSVNLWSTKNQREGEKELIPPLFGSFARNTQFTVELSQLIQTANKRGKLINREKVSKEIAIQEFEEVLRGLKVELRKSINEIIYSQSYLKVLTNQEQSLDQLILAYQSQVKQGNISRNELLRLQSSSLELENEVNETREELNEQLKTLKILLNAEPFVVIELEDVKHSTADPNNLSLATLLQTAFESRPDIKRQKLETQYHEKSLLYEKSLRIPDITLSAEYDRHGGVWKDYVGFGVSFSLPFLNRNQGGIKAARVSRDQSQYLVQQQQNIVRHEIAEVFSNYTQAYNFYTKISQNDLLTELDSMLDIYTKNLLNRNISMLEYLDFMDAYKTNKQTILASQKKRDTLFEELQYSTGTEIK